MEDLTKLKIIFGFIIFFILITLGSIGYLLYFLIEKNNKVNYCEKRASPSCVSYSCNTGTLTENTSPYIDPNNKIHSSEYYYEFDYEEKYTKK